MRRLALLLALFSCDSGPETPILPPEPLDPPPLARGVLVDRVELVQAAPVVLMAEREAVPGARPIIAGRPGLIRAHVVRDGRRPDLLVDVQLELVRPDGSVDVRTIEDFTVPSEVDENRLEDTANFEIDEDDLIEGIRWSIAVFEPEAERVRTGDHERPGARFPEPGRGAAPLRVGSHDAVLDVYIIPFSYQADGSGRLPPISEERIGAMRDTLYKMYPVRQVNLTVLEVQPTEVEIASTSGLGDLLEDVADWRRENGIEPSAYVYGLVQPANSFSAFCDGSCTIGLSYLVSNPNADGLRASVGVGFESVSADTFVHELGHAHGRRHAPCGNVSNADPTYPHDGGRIGGAGWDVIDGVLLSADEHRDFMGYCTPRWVSAYQLEAIYTQMIAVDGMFSLAPPEPQPVWTLAMRPGQPPRLRRIHETVLQPGGEPVAIAVLGGDGIEVDQVEGQFYAFGHGGGGTLMVPDAGGVALRLPDGSIVEREVRP